MQTNIEMQREAALYLDKTLRFMIKYDINKDAYSDVLKLSEVLNSIKTINGIVKSGKIKTVADLKDGMVQCALKNCKLETKVIRGFITEILGDDFVQSFFKASSLKTKFASLSLK